MLFPIFYKIFFLNNETLNMLAKSRSTENLLLTNPILKREKNTFNYNFTHSVSEITSSMKTSKDCFPT